MELDDDALLNDDLLEAELDDDADEELETELKELAEDSETLWLERLETLWLEALDKLWLEALDELKLVMLDELTLDWDDDDELLIESSMSANISMLSPGFSTKLSVTNMYLVKSATLDTMILGTPPTLATILYCLNVVVSLLKSNLMV